MAPQAPSGDNNAQTYTARGSVRAGGEASLETHGLSVAFDGTAGRAEHLAGPADLLCAALSACILKNVERFSHMIPFQYQTARIRVEADRVAPPPLIVRMRYELEVVTDEPADRVELLHRNILKYGTITNTLGKACEVTGIIRAVTA